MDIFHAVTQEIENVISCHWLSEFRESRFGNNSNNRTNTPGQSRSQSTAPPEFKRRDSSVSERRGSVSSTRTTSPILSRASSISGAEGHKMSSGDGTVGAGTGGMMDAEKGGESTQYESIQTVTKPHGKDSGQMGENNANTTTASSGVDSDRAQQTTENIRYGQNVSESGMGGKTTTSSGEGNQEGGYGGTKAQEDLESTGNPRTEQGYSVKDGTHDYNVGA